MKTLTLICVSDGFSVTYVNNPVIRAWVKGKSLRQAEMSAFRDYHVMSVTSMLLVLFGILGFCIWKLLPWGALFHEEKQGLEAIHAFYQGAYLPTNPSAHSEDRRAECPIGLKKVNVATQKVMCIAILKENVTLSCELFMKLSKAASSLSL